MIAGATVLSDNGADTVVSRSNSWGHAIDLVKSAFTRSIL
jgi:hypothetical protein